MRLPPFTVMLRSLSWITTPTTTLGKPLILLVGPLRRATAISFSLLDQSPPVDDLLARRGRLPTRCTAAPGAHAAPSQVNETSFIHPASIAPSTCIISLIPAEVRNTIYELLLINPNLGRASHNPWDEYGLHPAILRTCRKFYTEASAVLYGQEFFIKFLSTNKFNDSSASGRHHCLILRYKYYWLWDSDIHFNFFENASGITKVQRWNLLSVITTKIPGTKHPTVPAWRSFANSSHR
jgi:hypothetical protein